MWSFTLDCTALRTLDVLKEKLGLSSRGSVLGCAVTRVWREKVAAGEDLSWSSVVTDGSREDEILRRLHDLVRLNGTSISEVARLAIDRLWRASAEEGGLKCRTPSEQTAAPEDLIMSVSGPHARNAATSPARS
jgi:hypothetical protein